MANFIEEKNIINNHISGYINQITDFSKYIEGSPTFVTYYSRDIQATTLDIGLGGSTELIGTNSSIRYNKIMNFPIYNIEESQPTINYDDEDGLDTEIESTGVVLPDCGCKPLPDDYFVISYDNRKLLYRISDIEIGSVNDRVFYKISYFLSYENLDEIDRQITEEYETIYENLGQNSKESKIVLEKSIFEKIAKLKEIREELIDNYIEYYYNEDINIFLYTNSENQLIYDDFLMKFINDTDLFIKTKTYMENIYIEPLINSKTLLQKYRDTIYFSVFKKKSTFKYKNLLFTTIYKQYSPFYIHRGKYDVYQVEYMEKIFEGIPMLTSLYIDANPTYNIIDKYINKIDINTLYELVISYEYNYEDIECSYYLIPLLIYIIKDLILTIETNN